jgi:hypothetical protein
MTVFLKIVFSLLWLVICFFASTSFDKAEKQGRGPFNFTRLLMYLAIPFVLYTLWLSPLIKNIIK